MGPKAREHQALGASDEGRSIIGTPKKAGTSDPGTAMELDCVLREVLESVLFESVAMDVMHEIYDPLMEVVDVPAVLAFLFPEGLLDLFKPKWQHKTTTTRDGGGWNLSELG